MACSPQTSKRCFLLPLLVFLLCCSPWQLISAQKRIRSLPGFDGPLPFALETGYVEVDEEKGIELFYYFVESERNPVEDPLLLWLTGGPGCSGLSGLVFEIGPLGFDLQNYVDGLPSLYYKPDSWTQVSNIIFVDSPVGTGFSYSRTEEGLQTSDTLAVQGLLQFLYKWLEKHPKFKSNPFYVSGSSYSGKIIPVLTLEIAIAQESHGAPFNLKGYLEGNPVTDDNIDDNSIVPFYHRMTIISDELYESTKQSCSGNYLKPSNIGCAKYLDAVNEITKGLNTGDILAPPCESHNPGLGLIQSWTIRNRFYNKKPPKMCKSPLFRLSELWANNDTARDALGVRKGTIIADWQRCTRDTLPYTKEIESAVPYHHAVTNKGYLALIYSGDHDATVPHIGTQTWIRSLNSSIVDDWRPWYVGDQVAGFTRRYSNNLTFATVMGAGHVAPLTKLKECTAMLSRWLFGAPL